MRRGNTELSRARPLGWNATSLVRPPCGRRGGGRSSARRRAGARPSWFRRGAGGGGGGGSRRRSRQAWEPAASPPTLAPPPAPSAEAFGPPLWLTLGVRSGGTSPARLERRLYNVSQQPPLAAYALSPSLVKGISSGMCPFSDPGNGFLGGGAKLV